MYTTKEPKFKDALDTARAVLQLIILEDDLYTMLAERKALVEIEAATNLGEGLPSETLGLLFESVSRIVARHGFELAARQLTTEAALLTSSASAASCDLLKDRAWVN